MNCQEVLSLLSECLDGDLDKFTQKQIQCHIEECPACKKQYASLSKSMRILRAAIKMKP